MANATKAAAKRKTMSERSAQMRQEFWPHIPEDALWHRKRNDGYSTIPRTLAIVMSIIDSLSKNKPAGQTYFVLWCRAWDESMLTVDNPAVFAAETGFTGERALSTWKERMKTLAQLGFIDAKAGASGDYHYVLILNPHLIIRMRKEDIQQSLYMRLYERGQEIGATDITDAAKILDEVMTAPDGKAKGSKPKKK
ncbi:MAG: hypothetical protein JWN63_231 [Candidatus Acidoferrum typicum]|nr:hypothetical protein [Candidatus Acidoferrum typicum]